MTQAIDTSAHVDMVGRYFGMKIKTRGRKVADVDRVTIVWITILEPVAFKHASTPPPETSGLRFRVHGALVFQRAPPPNKADPQHYRTLMQLCLRLTPDVDACAIAATRDSSDDTDDSEPSVAPIADITAFLIDAGESNIDFTNATFGKLFATQCSLT